MARARAERPTRGLTRPASWLLLIGLWMIPPLLATTSYVLTVGEGPAPVSRNRFLWNQIVLWFPWVLLTPVVGWLGRRWPARAGRRLRDLAMHLAASVAIGTLFLAYVVLREVAGGLELARLSGSAWLAAFSQIALLHAAVYWILLLASWAVAYHQRNREREASLTRARLSALKAQVHPHFLFNTLHTISTLMGEDVVAARRMISRLSDLLRESLSSSGEQEVRLAQELELLRLYLEIEEQRFEDRLRVEIRIEPEVEDALVPHLLLQPLAENAIRHGISKDSKAGRLEVSAERRNGKLVIAVTDDGAGPERPQEDGIGLGTTRERLRELYGPEGGFELEPASPRGCRARVEIPLRWS